MTDESQASTRPARRRSRHVSVLLLGATALAAGGCGEDYQTAEAEIFPNTEACIADYRPEECETARRQAEQLHLQTAPRFATRAECEQALGADACQEMPVAQANGGMSNVFVPAMMGFMLGRMMSGPSYRHVARPVYLDREGFLYTGGRRIGSVPGGRDGFLRSGTGTRISTVMNRQGQFGRATTTRGGFGYSAGRFGGGG